MTAQYASALAFHEPESAPETRAPAIELSQPALYRRFKPLFRPRPIVYWSDMLTSAVIGWSGFALSLAVSPNGVVGLIGLAVAVAGLYRAALFIHEIAHLKHGSIDGFAPAWNVLVGVPLLVPSLMYAGTHADHHRRSQFGTDEDPEYEAIASWDPLRIVTSFLVMFAVPLMLLARWGIAGPLSYLFPPLRRFLVERASTLVINPSYRRRQLKDSEKWEWAWQEGLLALWIWGALYALYQGWVPLDWALHWYALPTGMLLLNHARTLAAHRYYNEQRVAVDRMEQLLDSINLTGDSWLTRMAAPVGLRFHALHHLLPTLPYHSLGVVHRTLERELPSDSPYHETAQRTLLRGLSGLMAQARRNASRAAANAQPSYGTRAVQGAGSGYTSRPR